MPTLTGTHTATAGDLHTSISSVQRRVRAFLIRFRARRRTLHESRHLTNMGNTVIDSGADEVVLEIDV